MRRVVMVLGLSSLSLLAMPPLRADEPPVRQASHDHTRPHADCYCRAQGRVFAYGENACLITPDGPRLAQCLMALNVTSWAISRNPCPQS